MGESIGHEKIKNQILELACSQFCLEGQFQGILEAAHSTQINLCSVKLSLQTNPQYVHGAIRTSDY